ncbi:MAG: hypothetical protein RL477_1182 [Pseudomonadota bacterium]
MTAGRTLLRFGPISRPVAFTGCDGLVESVAARLCGWTVAPWLSADAPAPVISIAARGGKFSLISDFIAGEETYDDATDAVCALLAEVIMAMSAEAPDTLFLHAGAAVVNGRLIVYPARGKTGKSTLTAQLAAQGARVFSDDVVPVSLDTRRARALGIEPHLRLPLAGTLAADERRWIEDHTAVANRRTIYVGLPRSGPGALAPLGEECAIGAFVLLDRGEGIAPELAPCPRPDIMKLIIRQHFGAARPAADLLPGLKALIESAPCFRLRYSGGSEAASLLRRMEKTT